MRAEKGITLVALVITIIVLLILAVVSIGAVTQSGIWEKANEAKTKYTDEQINENKTLNEYNTILHQYDVQ